MCPIPNGFRDRAIWTQTAKLLIRKRYYEYVLYLIPVFIVQMTELVQFVINVRNFHRFTCFRQWRSRAGVTDNTGRPSQTIIQSNVSISETVRNRTRVHIKFFCLGWPVLWPPRILTFPPGTPCTLRTWHTSYIYIYIWRRVFYINIGPLFLCDWVSLKMAYLSRNI